MITPSKEAKSQPSLIDLLGGSTKTGDASGNGLFSKLLASLGQQTKGSAVKIDTKSETAPSAATEGKGVIHPKSIIVRTLQNAETAAAATKTPPISEFESLLKGNTEEKNLILPELLNTLSEGQLRTLIHKAKEYLKNEIMAKSPELSREPESIPATLGGLIRLADKLGLKPETITLSMLPNEPENPIAEELLSKPLLDIKALTHFARNTDQTPVEGKTAPADPLLQLLQALKEGKNPAETTETSKKGERDLKTLLEGNEPAKSPANETKTAKTTPQGNETTLPPAPGYGIKEETSKNQAVSPAPTEGLIALLQGEAKGGERENTEKTVAGKTEIEGGKSFAPPKAESIEVKAKEAQQGLRHFAGELKEAVENYKPPFTRLSMKLNPERLGEVEVTLVQRGNNVHVNIQSNNAASVAFLAHNATELKAQLAHQGITNATMNFMSGGEQNPSGGGGQQHHSQNRFRAYESLAELERSEEQLGALEIIIPHYA